MAEVFDIEKERDSFLSRMVIQATTQIPQDQFEELLEKAKEKSEHEDRFVVSFTLNGIELSVRQIAKWLEDAFDGCVNERAEELIQERLQGRLEQVTDVISQFQQDLQDAINKARP